jgi:hypothetical protein
MVCLTLSNFAHLTFIWQTGMHEITWEGYKARRTADGSIRLRQGVVLTMDKEVQGGMSDLNPGTARHMQRQGQWARRHGSARTMDNGSQSELKCSQTLTLTVNKHLPLPNKVKPSPV